MVARNIFYSGRVQGVGFRYTTKRIAAEFEVSGWVRNLSDGRVELLVMAQEADELDAFLTELQENSELANHIRDTETHSVPPPAGVTGFSILR
jgi:acylphosphatase